MPFRVTLISNPTRQRIGLDTTNRQRVSVTSGSGVGGGNGVSRLQDLVDVNASDVDNGETVVYDEATGKFIVKDIDIIDGGTF